jgi:hypothetical protein
MGEGEEVAGVRWFRGSMREYFTGSLALPRWIESRICDLPKGIQRNSLSPSERESLWRPAGIIDSRELYPALDWRH